MVNEPLREVPAGTPGRETVWGSDAVAAMLRALDVPYIALWTVVYYGVPCLFLFANNRSFHNDERHQARVARERGRPLENKWIGQRIAEPDIDLAAMARAQGAIGIGPVWNAAELAPAIDQAIRSVREGAVRVVDVRVAPGYDNQ